MSGQSLGKFFQESYQSNKVVSAVTSQEMPFWLAVGYSLPPRLLRKHPIGIDVSGCGRNPNATYLRNFAALFCLQYGPAKPDYA